MSDSAATAWNTVGRKPGRELRQCLGSWPLGRLGVAWLCVLAAALLWQQRFGTVPDTSWLITVCEKVLSGERLYADIVETNPPFSLWLYMPAVALAQKLGLAAELAVHAFAFACAVFGLALAGWIAAKAGFEENPRLLAWSPVLLAVFVVLPGNAWTQREHLGTALFLPLLALMAWRARPDAPARPSFRLAAVAGLCGSVLLLIKPYYAVSVLVPALWIAWRRRRLALLLAPEYWAAAAACLSYGAAVFWLYPDFLHRIYPLLTDTYMRVTNVTPTLLLFGKPLLLLAGFFVWLARKGACPETASVACLAALAAFLPLLYQGKGWSYHAYPMLALLSVALVCLLAGARWLPLPGRSGSAGTRLGPVAATVLLVGLGLGWLPFLSTQKPDARLVSAVREATVAPTIVLIGSDIADGHPLTRMVGGTWLSAYASDWLGAFALGLGHQARESGNAEAAARYLGIEQAYLGAKRGEFGRLGPDIVLLDRKDRFWVAELLEQRGLAAALENYRLIAEEGGLAVFLRKDYRKPLRD